MTPVITFTDGRCVAMTKCIPAARASWASLAILVSQSAGDHHHEVRQFVYDADDVWEFFGDLIEDTFVSRNADLHLLLLCFSASVFSVSGFERPLKPAILRTPTLAKVS